MWAKDIPAFIYRVAKQATKNMLVCHSVFCTRTCMRTCRPFFSAGPLRPTNWLLNPLFLLATGSHLAVKNACQGSGQNCALVKLPYCQYKQARPGKDAS